MTRYQLPDALGGGEYDEAPITGAIASCKGFIIDGHTVAVHEALLTEVVPPLPPEPPPGSVVRACGRVFEQRPDGEPGRWFDTWTNGWTRWSKVCEEGPPALLVPDPLAGAPELPWEHRFTDGGPLKVCISSASNRAAYVEGWGHLTAEEARTMGLALLAAATAEDAVERLVSGVRCRPPYGITT
jgi:hypothetical protein